MGFSRMWRVPGWVAKWHSGEVAKWIKALGHSATRPLDHLTTHTSTYFGPPYFMVTLLRISCGPLRSRLITTPG